MEHDSATDGCWVDCRKNLNYTIMYHTITHCRACGSTDLVPVFNLSLQPLANDWQKPNAEQAGYAPLEILMCQRCTLAQLSVVVRPEIMYAHYSYVTSKSDMMRQHFVTIMADINNEHAGADHHRLLEIGSNDGTFLEFAERYGFDVVGYEPAINLAHIAQERGVRTIGHLFGFDEAAELLSTGFHPHVIVARHVFCHVDDWRDFVKGLEMVSHKDTLIFIEVPYVGDMFKQCSWDQVYSEHLSYMSITAMAALLKGTTLFLHKIIHYRIHGGAIGIMLRHCDYENTSDDSVQKYLTQESVETLMAQWALMVNKAADNRAELKELLTYLYLQRAKVCAFGASAKATVWINACRFTSRDIAFVCDSTEQKQGCLIPGTDISVVPESRLMEADYALLTAWNFASEIMAKQKAFTDKGGRWIIPTPEVRIV